jgi:hypothetical protein
MDGTRALAHPGWLSFWFLVLDAKDELEDAGVFATRGRFHAEEESAVLADTSTIVLPANRS